MYSQQQKPGLIMQHKVKTMGKKSQTFCCCCKPYDLWHMNQMDKVLHILSPIQHKGERKDKDGEWNSGSNLLFSDKFQMQATIQQEDICKQVITSCYFHNAQSDQKGKLYVTSISRDTQLEILKLHTISLLWKRSSQ